MTVRRTQAGQSRVATRRHHRRNGEIGPDLKFFPAPWCPPPPPQGYPYPKENPNESHRVQDRPPREGVRQGYFGGPPGSLANPELGTVELPIDDGRSLIRSPRLQRLHQPVPPAAHRSRPGPRAHAASRGATHRPGTIPPRPLPAARRGRPMHTQPERAATTMRTTPSEARAWSTRGHLHERTRSRMRRSQNHQGPHRLTRRPTPGNAASNSGIPRRT